ncbi:MAG: hypothetical protein ACRCU6_09085 [Fusobacteriaceae bacterium]
MTTEQAVSMFSNKIIRKIEDLDGFENGMGLKVFVDKNDKTLSVGVPWKMNLINRIKLSEVDDEIISLIKAMGFEFEWKPKFVEDEILDKYEPNKFEKDVFKYRIWFNGKNYSYVYDDEFGVFGYCYYNKKTAEEICEKLNS